MSHKQRVVYTWKHWRGEIIFALKAINYLFLWPMTSLKLDKGIKLKKPKA